MNFKEIMEIDRHPFSDSWRNTFYMDIMVWQPYDAYSILTILLLQRYLEKCNEKYSMPVYDFDHDNDLYLLGNLKNIPEYEESIEFVMDYEGNCMNLFTDMAYQGYFEIMYINIDPYEWDIPKYRKKKYIKKKLRQCEPSWRPFIWKNLEQIENTCYLENAEVYILRNREISFYRTICQRYEETVDKYLRKEREALDAVIEDMAYPLCFESSHGHGYLGDYYYIYFDTGFNGYEYLDMRNLNYTWVLSCFVFRMLLKDFKEKARQVIDFETDWGNEQ